MAVLCRHRHRHSAEQQAGGVAVLSPDACQAALERWPAGPSDAAPEASPPCARRLEEATRLEGVPDRPGLVIDLVPICAA
jgi:hypothetical protein